MIRPYMQLGWFMAYALGAMRIRDNGHVVVKAWCADTEDGVFVGHRSSGMADAQPVYRTVDMKIECPNCKKLVPKADVDGSYPYDCCNDCYEECMNV